MGELFKKKNCLTIPNLLSIIRLLLIPVILWLYRVRTNYPAAAAVIGLSGLSDVLDGYIARKYNQISDLGKLLDPLADKLTQMALLLCLVTRYPAVWSLILLFAVKELTSWTLGAMVIRKEHSVNGAQWYGKVNTVVLYAVLAVLLLFPRIPSSVASRLIVFSGIVMLATFFLYARFHILALIKPNKKAA